MPDVWLSGQRTATRRGALQGCCHFDTIIAHVIERDTRVSANLPCREQRRSRCYRLAHLRFDGERMIPQTEAREWEFHEMVDRAGAAEPPVVVLAR